MATGFSNDPNRNPKFRKRWKIRLALSPAKWGDEEAETTATVDLTDEAGEGVEGEFVLRVNDAEYEGKTNDKGRATKRVTHLRLGKNKFEAQLKDMPSVRDTEELDVEPKLAVTASEPVLGDDGMESTVNVTAELAFRPIKDADVQLILDGRKYGAAKSTEDDGRAEVKVKPLAKGDHRIYAEIVGTAIRSKAVTIAVKEEKQKKLAEPVVRFEGKDGKYVLLTALVHEDGTVCRNEPVFLTTPEVLTAARPEDRKPLRLVTDPDGALSHPIEFTDPSWTVVVRVRAWEKKFTLLGSAATKPSDTEADIKVNPREPITARLRKAFVESFAPEAGKRGK